MYAQFNSKGGTVKVKTDFVTNSSSTSYIITNHTKRKLTIVDFVKENPHLIGEFIQSYGKFADEELFTQEKLIESAKSNNITFKPGESKRCVFGDEQGTLIGHVFDYILRYNGKSKNFSWELDEFLR